MRSNNIRFFNGYFLGLVTLFFCNLIVANDIKNPRIAIVIDDLGNQLKQGRRVVNLSGSISVGILPGRPFSKRLAEEAFCNGKEIILHMPMQAKQDKALGSFALHQDMIKPDFINVLTTAINSLPNLSGLNNHMGSSLTQQSVQMNWLMHELKRNNLEYYLDSRTTNRSIALSTAKNNNMPAIGRDVFLDTERDITAINNQFERLLKIAKKRGYAVAIGHPYDETLSFLEKALPKIKQQGFSLVTPSELIGDNKKTYALKFFQDIKNQEILSAAYIQ